MLEFACTRFNDLRGNAVAPRDQSGRSEVEGIGNCAAHESFLDAPPRHPANPAPPPDDPPHRKVSRHSLFLRHFPNRQPVLKDVMLTSILRCQTLYLIWFVGAHSSSMRQPRAL